MAGFRSFVLTVLSLTSLGSTGYLLYYIPPTSRAGNGGLRRGREGGDDDDDDVGGGLAIGDGEGGNKGPVTRYLQLLNGGFCVVLGIAALMEVRSFRNSYSGMGGANSNEQGIVLWVVPIGKSFHFAYPEFAPIRIR